MPDPPAHPSLPSVRSDAARPIAVRPMWSSDLELGLRLKVAAGWNQTRADWHMLLEAGAARHFVASYDGTEAGCVTVLPYDGAFSWIGMLQVDPAFSRHRRGKNSGKPTPSGFLSLVT